jgi:hypothetical protein
VKRGVTNVSQSVRDRLTALAHARREQVQRVFERYAMERVLHRLSRTHHRGRLVLKGAALWVVWGGPGFRPTRDLDFLGSGSPLPADVETQFEEILRAQVDDDGLVFPDGQIRAEPIRKDDVYGGVRVRFVATMARALVPVQVDVGFGAAAVPEPVEVAYPTLLGAAPPRVLAYRPETSLAEKFEAAVTLGDENGRFKDFYDLREIPAAMSLDGVGLTHAIAATFAKRGTSLPASIDDALPGSFFESERSAASWRAYLSKNGLRATPSDFVVVGYTIRAFLGPVLEAAAGRGVTPGRWTPGGPWR